MTDGMQSIENRKYLENLLQNGSISETLKETDRLYPNLLPENCKLEFLLKCRQFVELLTTKNPDQFTEDMLQVEFCSNDLNGSNSLENSQPRPEPEMFHLNGDAPSSSSNGVCLEDTASNGANENSMMGFTTDLASSSNSAQPNSSNNESAPAQSYAQGHDSDDSCEMDMDSNSCHSNLVQPQSSEENRESGLSPEDIRIMKAVSLGRKLRQLADKVALTADCQHESVEQQLLEVFGLLAYENPHESPLKHVLECSNIERVCNLLNGAILQSHNMSAEPQLQTLLVQSASCLQEMTALGIPEAAFVSLKDILK